ncbi:hypothetical protein JYU11_03065, partial [bacterium AH-315-G05]|nr:hypothetical protein [bacterium AH-315-G05]
GAGVLGFKDWDAYVFGSTQHLHGQIGNNSDFSISIDTSENPVADHYISLLDPAGAMERHQTIIKELMKVAFEEDFDEAWVWFVDTVEFIENGGSLPSEVRTLNERSVSISGGGTVYMSFSEKGGLVAFMHYQ